MTVQYWFSQCCLNNPNIKEVSGQGGAVDNIKWMKPNKYWERKVAYWALSKIIQKESGRLGLGVGGRRGSDGERSIVVWFGSLDSKPINENLGKQEAPMALCPCARLGVGSASPNSCFSSLCSLTWSSLQLSSVKWGVRGGERAGDSISCCSQAAVCTLLRKWVCHHILFTSYFSLQHCLFVVLWKFIFKTTNKIAFSCFRKSAFC